MMKKLMIITALSLALSSIPFIGGYSVTKADAIQQSLSYSNLLQAKKAVVDAGFTGDNGTEVDGVKMYQNVVSALDDAPADATSPYVIYIKNGLYYEKLNITKPYITLIGENKDNTVLTYDDASDTKKPDGSGTYGTTGSASITITGSHFTIENMTITNGFDYNANAQKDDSDPTKMKNAQAVAMKTDKGSDQAYFKNVNFLGYQDTLYLNSGTHYFTNCYVAGNIDFIFGAGQGVFNYSDIVSLDRGNASNNGFVSAPSTKTTSKYGFLFINSRILKGSVDMADNSVGLGRPWHPTSNLPDGTRAADPDAVGAAAYINCYLDSHIKVQGWDPMSGKDKDGKTFWFYPKDSRFYEYGNSGPGAYKNDDRKTLTAIQASQEYTISNVLGGWTPEL